MKSFLDEAREAFSTWQTPSDVVVYELDNDWLHVQHKVLNPTIEVSTSILPYLKDSLKYVGPQVGSQGYINVDESIESFKYCAVYEVSRIANHFKMYTVRNKLHEIGKTNAFVEDCIKIGIVYKDTLSDEIKKELLKKLVEKYGETK